MKIFQFLKEEIYSRYNFNLIIFLLLFTACDRNYVTQPADDGLPPVTPVNLSIFRERDGEVGIEWRRNREPDIKNYKIYRSENNIPSLVLIDSTIDEYYIDYYLEYEITYNYCVSAVDIFDRESPLTAPVSAKPVNVYSPDAPYLIEVNGRNWDGELSVHLFWYPVEDSDLFGYEIYRSTAPEFTIDESNLLVNCPINEFDDTSDLAVLTTYYYKIISVDKGNLKSSAGPLVSDIILNTPLQIFPQNNTQVTPFGEFEIRSVSEPAYYKIVILSNPFYGIVTELLFQSDFIDSVIPVEFSSAQLEIYKRYYWRIFTYTKNYRDPNSYSDLYSFTINP